MATQSPVGSNASANSTTVSMPAGIAAGDRAFFFDSAVAGGGTPPTAVAPSGFTLLATHTATNGTFSVRHSVYYKDLSGSETTLTGMAVGVTCNKAVFVTRKSAGAVWETPGDVSVVASATSISSQTVNVPSGAVLVLAYGDDFGTVGTGAGRLTMSPAGTYADAGTIRIGYINYGSSPADNTASSSVTAGGVLSSFYQRVLDSTDTVTASNFSTGSPSIGAPAVGQNHSLIATSLSTGSPAIGTPAVGQNHGLVASSLATGSPVLGTPTAGVAHVLTAASLTTSSPEIGAPAVSQNHALAAAGIATGAPVLGTPTASSSPFTVAVNAEDLTTGSPSFGPVVIRQGHNLAANGITTGPPVIGSPGTTHYDLGTPPGISVGPPVVGTPTLVRYRGSAPALGANIKRRFVGDFRVGNVFASEIVTDESGRSVRQVTILAADAARPAITLRLIGSTPGRLRFNPQR